MVALVFLTSGQLRHLNTTSAATFKMISLCHLIYFFVIFHIVAYSLVKNQERSQFDVDVCKEEPSTISRKAVCIAEKLRIFGSLEFEGITFVSAS